LKNGEKVFNCLSEILDENQKAEIMTYATKLDREGRKKGRVEGRVEGMYRPEKTLQIKQLNPCTNLRIFLCPAIA